MYHYGVMLNILMTLFNKNYVLVIPSFKFDMIDVLEALVKYKCNSLSGLPKILHSIVNHPARKSYDLSNLNVAMAGGQSVSSDMIETFKNHLDVKMFIHAYGSTEMNNFILRGFKLDEFDPSLYKNCVGKAAPFMECKIVNPETGKIQPLDQEGELYVRCYSVTNGYWNDEEKTREAIDQHRW
jgi:fatty-acyl-CoA synthase